MVWWKKQNLRMIVSHWRFMVSCRSQTSRKESSLSAFTIGYGGDLTSNLFHWKRNLLDQRNSLPIVDEGIGEIQINKIQIFWLLVDMKATQCEQPSSSSSRVFVLSSCLTVISSASQDQVIPQTFQDKSRSGWQSSHSSLLSKLMSERWIISYVDANR